MNAIERYEIGPEPSVTRQFRADRFYDGVVSEIIKPPSIRILFESDDLVVVNKPGGIAVHRNEHSRRDEFFCLQLVRDLVGTRVNPVHRLDRATSGVLIFAKSPDSTRLMQESLSAPGTVKSYLTLARGRIHGQVRCSRPLRNEAGNRGPCLSVLSPLAHFGGDEPSTLLRVHIHSGRFHQIRRHLNHLGHHVVGDTTHGKGHVNRWYRDHFALPRMFLHAERVSTFYAPLPSDLAGVLGLMRTAAHATTAAATV